MTGIDVARRARARRCGPTAGDIEAEVVVNAGGMYAAEIGRLAGVRVPIVPMAHQYLVTQPFRDRGDGEHLPTLRDPDLLVYFREEADGLVMGGYERDPRAVVARRRPGVDAIPPDFNGRLLEEDWDALRGDHRQRRKRRVPVMDEVDDHAADQRARGVHARQRVLPRRDRGRAASSSPPASAPTASPARAGSAR